MSKSIFLLFLFFIYVSVVGASSSEEIAAIEKTARNYMEGWYQGDVKRMKESLHPELAKRCLEEGYGDRKELRHITAPDMITYTNIGYGKNLWMGNYSIEIKVLDFYKNIASVKVIAPHYLEYLHLARVDKKWVIVNTLYEKKAPTKD